MKRQRRKTAAIRFGIGAVVVIAGIVVISIFTGNDDSDSDASATTTVATDTTTATTVAPPVVDPPEIELDPATIYTATIATNKGEIVAELDTEAAPTGAAHFIKLARDGFYDGLTWHRVVDDFMIQGGDPNGDGSGGSGASVVAEVPTDNYPIGSLAAAKAGPEPAGTYDAQFFVVTGSQGATLANDYARFGFVVSGIEVAQEMAALQAPEETPSEPLTIDSIVITESPRTSTPTSGA